MAGELTLSSISVMLRVESVSKARRAMSYMRRTFSMYSRGLAGSTGGFALTTGLRLLLPLRGLHQALLQVAHAGEVLVEPLAVARADVALQLLGLVGDGVQDALPERQPARSAPRPPPACRAGTGCLKTSDGLSSHGISTPPAVHERLRAPAAR